MVLPWAVAIVCAVVTVVMAALWIAVPFPGGATIQPPGGDVPMAQDANGATVPVTDAASAFMKLFTTSDYQDFDGWARRVQEQTTGQLATEFTAGLSNLRATFTTAKATATGEVLGVAVSDPNLSDPGGGRAVEVLLFVNATVHNTNAEGGRTVKYRVTLVMAVVDGRWKAAKLDFVG